MLKPLLEKHIDAIKHLFLICLISQSVQVLIQKSNTAWPVTIVKLLIFSEICYFIYIEMAIWHLSRLLDSISIKPIFNEMLTILSSAQSISRHKLIKPIQIGFLCWKRINTNYKSSLHSRPHFPASWCMNNGCRGLTPCRIDRRFLLYSTLNCWKVFTPRHWSRVFYYYEIE